jgi:hypothetical protein
MGKMDTSNGRPAASGPLHLGFQIAQREDVRGTGHESKRIVVTGEAQLLRVA